MSSPEGSQHSTGAAEGPRPRRSRLGFKMGLFMIALLGSAVAAELTLQIAAAFAGGRTARDSGALPAEDVITILSVGDSHTFGLPLPEEESYPAQLEVALADRHPDLKFQVVNLGIPGLNSAFVANRLERQMFQLRPHLVIVWVGVNNMWNVAETLGWEREDRWQPLRRALLDLKLFRLASIAWFSQSGYQYDPSQRGGWFDGELPPSGRLEAGKRLRDPTGSLGPDLDRMVELSHGLETPILLVAYPLADAGEINRTILAAGGRLGVGVIETVESLRRSVRAGHKRPELIDERAGPHPSRLLYAYVVEDMVPAVEAALAAWHGFAMANSPGIRGALPDAGPKGDRRP